MVGEQPLGRPSVGDGAVEIGGDELRVQGTERRDLASQQPVGGPVAVAPAEQNLDAIEDGIQLAVARPVLADHARLEQEKVRVVVERVGGDERHHAGEFRPPPSLDQPTAVVGGDDGQFVIGPGQVQLHDRFLGHPLIEQHVGRSSADFVLGVVTIGVRRGPPVGEQTGEQMMETEPPAGLVELDDEQVVPADPGDELGAAHPARPRSG